VRQRRSQQSDPEIDAEPHQHADCGAEEHIGCKVHAQMHPRDGDSKRQENARRHTPTPVEVPPQPRADGPGIQGMDRGHAVGDFARQRLHPRVDPIRARHVKGQFEDSAQRGPGDKQQPQPHADARIQAPIYRYAEQEQKLRRSEHRQAMHERGQKGCVRLQSDHRIDAKKSFHPFFLRTVHSAVRHDKRNPKRRKQEPGVGILTAVFPPARFRRFSRWGQRSPSVNPGRLSRVGIS
jgi:hypothetical protein